MKLNLHNQLINQVNALPTKNYYHIQGTTAKKMIFDDVRIPLKDPTTGRNYNINKFSRSLANFFKEHGMKVNRNMNGGTLYINVQ